MSAVTEMTVAHVTETSVDDPIARAAAFGLLAAMLGPRIDAWSPTEVDALATAATRLGTDLTEGLRALAPDRADEHADRHSHLFAQVRVAPYESSYVKAGAGGHTGRLADIAGFYRAFGFEVRGERPDHVVAELEFASHLAIGVAHARTTGDAEAVEVYEHAWRTFVRDHLGGWLDRFAARLEAIDPGGPFAPVVRAAARLVAGEAARLGVLVVEVDDDGALGELGEDGCGLECGGCGDLPRP